MKNGWKLQTLSLLGLMGTMMLTYPTCGLALETARAGEYSGDRSAETMICGDRNGDGTVDNNELAIFAAHCAINSDGFDIDDFVNRAKKGQIGNLCSCDGYALSQ